MGDLLDFDLDDLDDLDDLELFFDLVSSEVSILDPQHTLSLQPSMAHIVMAAKVKMPPRTIKV